MGSEKCIEFNSASNENFSVALLESPRILTCSHMLLHEKIQETLDSWSQMHVWSKVHVMGQVSLATLMESTEFVGYSPRLAGEVARGNPKFAERGLEGLFTLDYRCTLQLNGDGSMRISIPYTIAIPQIIISLHHNNRLEIGVFNSLHKREEFEALWASKIAELKKAQA